MLSHACVLHNVRAIARSMDLRRDNVGVCWLPAFHDMGLIGNLLGSVYFPGTMTLLSPLTMMQDPFRWLEAVSRTRADISGGPCFAYDLCVNRITRRAVEATRPVALARRLHRRGADLAAHPGGVRPPVRRRAASGPRASTRATAWPNRRSW